VALWVWHWGWAPVIFVAALVIAIQRARIWHNERLLRRVRIAFPPQRGG
jgi:hypothetical protein